MKLFKCFAKLNRSLCSSPLSGKLNFSLWIAEVLAKNRGVKLFTFYTRITAETTQTIIIFILILPECSSFKFQNGGHGDLASLLLSKEPSIIECCFDVTCVPSLLRTTRIQVSLPTAETT